MAIDWQAERQSVYDMVSQDGVSAVIFTESLGEYNVTTGKKETTTDESFDAFCIIKSFDQPDHTNILTTDLNILAVTTKEDANLKDKKNMKITVSGDTYKVLTASPVRPSGVTLLYNLHCRS